ncbi:MAG: DUF393 domain-containing protein [Chloroflexi bacterium]|nr:DUF393 domain-containing protein [Chloroflexota bacterium]
MSAPRLTMLFDADCGFCGRSAMLVRQLDRRRAIRIVPLQRAAGRVPNLPPVEILMETIHVVDADGHWSTGGAAWLQIMDEVPALRPVAVIARTPLIRPFVEPVYGWVSGHRQLLSRLLGAQACRYRPPIVPPDPAGPPRS